MNEQALIDALNNSPYDWDLRLQLVDALHQRGAAEDIASIIHSAPVPPTTFDQLNLAAGYGGVAAQTQAEAYVTQNPSDASGHFLLGQIYETAGHVDHAQQHYQAAESLGLATQAEAVPAEQGIQHVQVAQEPVVKARNRKTGKVTVALFTAILVHVIIIGLALWLVVFKAPPKEKEIVGRQLEPQTKKQELTKKNVVKQVKKSAASAAAAAPIAQLMKANAVAKFALPDVTKTSTGPLGLGDSGFGSFGTGGTGGAGLGSGGSFFGSSSTGKRFLFVLDQSGSMTKLQVELRNNELERALKSLNEGVQYQVLLFAGAALYAERGWEVVSKTEIKGPGGKKYLFKQNSVSDFEFLGTTAELPKTKWLDAKASNRSRTMRFIEDTKLFYGTDWGMALEIAHQMDPAPDVIFFMADGSGGNNPAPILKINAAKGKPIINTVAMQTTGGIRQFNEVAKKTKGSFTLVDKNGKPIKGDDYIKDPEKFRNRLQ